MTEAEESFDRIFDEHHLRVLAYVARRVGEPADAADIVAEVFMTAWRRLGRMPEMELPWLLGVARNLLRNHRRQQRRHSLLAQRLAQVLDERAAPAGAAADVLAELNTLSGADRELVMLTAWDGLTPAEAALVLGLKPSTARVRLHRARVRLRTGLLATCQGPVDRALPSAAVHD